LLDYFRARSHNSTPGVWLENIAGEIAGGTLRRWRYHR
jgi:hypothetical protein